MHRRKHLAGVGKAVVTADSDVRRPVPTVPRGLPPGPSLPPQPVLPPGPSLLCPVAVAAACRPTVGTGREQR